MWVSAYHRRYPLYSTLKKFLKNHFHRWYSEERWAKTCQLQIKLKMLPWTLLLSLSSLLMIGLKGVQANEIVYILSGYGQLVTSSTLRYIYSLMKIIIPPTCFSMHIDLDAKKERLFFFKNCCCKGRFRLFTQSFDLHAGPYFLLPSFLCNAHTLL